MICHHTESFMVSCRILIIFFEIKIILQTKLKLGEIQQTRLMEFFIKSFLGLAFLSTFLL